MLTLSLSTAKPDQVPSALSVLSDEDDSDLLKARTPLMTAKKLNQDFSRVLKERRRKGESEQTDVEDVEEEGAVAPLMTALHSEQSPHLRESPGKRFSHPISPLNKAAKSPNSRKPEDRSLVLQEMAKSIYSNFFQERSTMQGQRESSRSPLPHFSMPQKPSSPTSVLTALPKSTTSSPVFSRASSPHGVIHNVPRISPSLPAVKAEITTTGTNTDLLDVNQLEREVESLKSQVVIQSEDLETAKNRAESAENTILTLKTQIREMEEAGKIREMKALVARKEAEERANETKAIITGLETKIEAVAHENQALQQELRSLTLALSQANQQQAKDARLLAACLQELQQATAQRTSTPFCTTNRVMNSTPRTRSSKPAASSPVSDLENTSDTLHQPLSCPQPIKEPERYYDCFSESLEYTRLLQEQEKLQRQLQAIPQSSRSLANKRRKLALEFRLSEIVNDLEILKQGDKSDV